VETIANNLANAETNGFKRDEVAFQEYLTPLETEHTPPGIPRGPIRDRDLNPLDGKDQSFVAVEGTHTQFSPGALKLTGSPLDVAIEGPGFIEVGTPDGVRYSRAGNLKLNSEGKLVSPQGHPILLEGEPSETADWTSRTVSLKDQPGAVTITENGELYVGTNKIGKLAFTEFDDVRQLQKQGGQLFEFKGPKNIQNPNDPTRTVASTGIKPATASKIHQGMIEGSNVNPVHEMSTLIRANRMFEQDMKAIQTMNQLMGKESNEIGKL
jgi:flagellar basal-body rod protein FlgG